MAAFVAKQMIGNKLSAAKGKWFSQKCIYYIIYNSRYIHYLLETISYCSMNFIKMANIHFF